MFLRRFVYLTVAALAIAGIWLQTGVKKPSRLEVYKQVPDFQLIERNGKTVTLSDLKGKVWVADFFYASCPGPCPVISTRLGALQEELAGNDNVRLVSITTQPDTDTPEVLRQYAKRFNASDKWLFLTGDKAQIYNLSNKGFLLTAQDQNGNAEEPVIHSTKLALVDRNGNIRGYYDGADEANIKLIATDIKALLRE
jgi:protein SCO1/2